MLLLVILGLLVGGSIIWSAGSILTRPVSQKFDAPPQHAVEVSFSSKSGSRISGWFYKAEAPVGVAVLMHGIRSNRGQMTARAEQLLELNISSLVFDFQAHGASPGTIITLGHLESYDAQAALTYVKSVEPDLPVLIIGVSMGGAATLLAKPTLDVEVIVLESVYPDITTAISNRLASRLPAGRLFAPLLSYQIKPRAGVSASDLSPVNEAARVTAATLVLNGSEDTHTTIEDSVRLYEMLPEPKDISIINGAGHVDLESFAQEKYWSIVKPFILSHLHGD